MDRREFVAASGLVAIAGCLARGNESDDDGSDGDEALPESLAGMFDPIPADVDDLELRQIATVVPDPDARSNQGFMVPNGHRLGLEAEDMDRGLSAMYGEFDGTIGVISGDFEADDLEEPRATATSIEDGRVVMATSEGGSWDAGLEAAEAVDDDEDAGVEAEKPVEALFGPIAEMQYAVGLLEVDEETIPEDASIDTEAVEAVGMGQNSDVDAREQTITYVAVFAEDATPDGAVIEEILRTNGDDGPSPEDVDVETDDRRAMTTFTRDLPQSQLPDNSPDVYVGVVSDMEEGGAVSLVFSGDESVDATNLEYRVDGEPADPPWEEDATIEPESRFEIDVPPLTHVAVLWVDPELEDVTQPLGSTVVGSQDAFEAQYDHDADELTIEYTADRTLEPDGFEVQRQVVNSSSEGTTPLSEHVDTLEPGTEFVVSDVQYGDYVTINMEVGEEFGPSGETVFWYEASPPGHFRHEREDGAHVLVYRGETEASAENFRVLVNGEPADAQWSDVAETLSDGERLEIDAAPGDELTVEYLGGDEPIEVLSRSIVPSAEFEFDVGESSVEITHESGDAMDAEPLSVHLHPTEESPREDAFSEYDTVEPGDSITLEYEVEDGEELQAVVILYDGRMVTYTELGEDDHSGSDGDSGTDSDSGSDGGSDSMDSESDDTSSE